MSRRPVRLPTDGRPFLELLSLGRPGPSGRFSPAQIEQIRRTVNRTPEVMVKVTGGGTKNGAVAAHLAYISRNGKLAIETDEGDRAAGRDAQKALLRDWHLDLSAGQYRGPREGRATARAIKLVHNIVLSMPSPTPADKVLAAARKFAREKFALQHRYAMVLHTDQQHPHVHMVVKAESEEGRRLHIDKAMLREWREDFARLMREQGIAANATPRVIRGRNKGKTRDAIYRARRRGASNVVHERVTDIAKQLVLTGSFHDPARAKLLETRKSVVNGWLAIADGLDVQGEVVLAGDVRHFARHLPRVLTDREIVAKGLLDHLGRRLHKGPVSEVTRMRREEFTR
jgi:hypothetical protein